MVKSIMYQEDGYVVLENNKPEQLMIKEELYNKLKQFLKDLPEKFPSELEKFASLEEKTQYLLDNYCELDLGEGQYLQWYVTRWEK
jgi:hypothetical protein